MGLILTPGIIINSGISLNPGGSSAPIQNTLMFVIQNYIWRISILAQYSNQTLNNPYDYTYENTKGDVRYLRDEQLYGVYQVYSRNHNNSWRQRQDKYYVYGNLNQLSNGLVRRCLIDVDVIQYVGGQKEIIVYNGTPTNRFYKPDSYYSGIIQYVLDNNLQL